MGSLSKEVETNLLEARNRIWRARGRRSRELGTALLGVSLVMFLLAYLTNYLLFEVTSILSLFLGVVFLFTSMEPHVKTAPAGMMAKSSLLSLKDLVGRNGGGGKTVYYYDDKDDKPNMMIGGLQQANGEVSGRALYPIGNDLVKLYEEELGKLKGVGLDHIVEWLPRLLTDGLKLVESVEFARDNDEVRVTIKRPTFETLCLSDDLKKGVCDTMGCQLQGSIAQTIALGTGRRISFDGCNHYPDSRKSVSTYRML